MPLAVWLCACSLQLSRLQLRAHTFDLVSPPLTFEGRGLARLGEVSEHLWASSYAYLSYAGIPSAGVCWIGRTCCPSPQTSHVRDASSVCRGTYRTEGSEGRPVAHETKHLASVLAVGAVGAVGDASRPSKLGHKHNGLHRNLYPMVCMYVGTSYLCTYL